MKTTIVPILKNKSGDTGVENNYRPIALVTACSKIFELCILSIIENHICTHDHQFGLTLSGPGYLMSLKVRGEGTYAPPLISKSTNSILMTLYATLYKNCSHYRSAICFKIGLGLAEIIRCLCTKVVFL